MTTSGAQQGIRPGVCLSTSRPASPYIGQIIYMTDVNQSAVWDGTSWSGLDRSRDRNVVINGAFSVWQRGTTTGTLGLAGGTYVGPDRWWYYNNGFTSTISRQLCGSTLPQFLYCARIQRTSGQTGTQAMVMFSPQETINSVRFAGKTAVLSFYARASAGVSTAAPLGLNVFTGTGVDQNNYTSGYTNLTSAGGLNPTLTTSWQRFSTSFGIASNVTELGIQLNFIGVGTAGASDYVEITGIQLEEGAVATPFEFEDYSETLRKCQRYYFRLNSTATETPWVLAYARSTTVLDGVLQFPTPMRVAPTSIEFSSIGALQPTIVLTAVSALTYIAASPFTANLVATTTGLTQYRTYFISNNGSSGYIAMSAEL